ncbi:MAG: outer membrane lipid asymmetry maintenance protein MlaD [Candidatus Competibacteraceae bacterium]|nr:outer membrane lipid asymmetry maintenance protein MlaD [Candidatus Competibacteraceae bacterium]
MSTTKTLELTVGLFAVLGLAAFFMLAMQVSNIRDLGNGQGYVVNAHFDNIGGLKVRAPVTLAGVRIGRVVSIDIDTQTYEAVVRLSVDPSYQLPTDSSASILTSGLLGEQYVGLEPGGMDDYLQEGDRIKLTQSALVLEKLVGRLFTSMASEDK